MIVYRERVLPSVANLLLPLLLFPSVFAVMLPIDATLALPVASLCTLAFIAVIVNSSPVITVDQKVLTAKGATIETKFLGKAEVVPKEEIFREMGPQLDARAWLSIQASVKGLVKIQIEDPEDPTPYWLVSTRRPEVLSKLLNSKN